MGRKGSTCALRERADNDGGGLSPLWAAAVVALVCLGGIVLLVRRRSTVATT